jgi:hypothetical protein
VSLSQDFEKKVEIGLRLNSKLSEFAKTLPPEEQRGLGALVRLAEFAIENGGIALFGLENRETLRKVRRKLIELNCDSPSSPEQALQTTPAVAVTLADIDALFK